MPVISKSNVGFQGGYFLRVMKVDSKGNFSCNLPGPVAQHLGIEDAIGNTKDACEKEYKRIVTEYENATKKERTVIIFDYRSHDTGSRMGRSGGVEIDLKADVCIEREITDAAGKTRWSYEKISKKEWPDELRGVHIWGGAKDKREEDLVEYTPQTLAFFQDVAEGMNKLAALLGELVSTPATLEAYKSGGLKMLANK